MSTFHLDLKQAFQSLGKSPGFLAATLLTLGLGIGATVTMFSAVHGLLLRPLPYQDPHRLVAVYEGRIDGSQSRLPLSMPGFFDYRERSRSFEGLVAYDAYVPTLLGSEGASRLFAGRTTAGFFELLGVEPHLGSFYGPSNEIPGEHRVAVLSHCAWSQRFGCDKHIVGRTLLLDGESFTILGIAPAAFTFPFSSLTAEAEIFVPIPKPLKDESYGHRLLSAMGRLRHGVDIANAEAELKGIAAESSRTHTDTPPWTAHLKGLQEDWVGDQARPLLMLMSAVGVLLLIACVNVGNLILARAESRRKEVAIRASLGAGTRHLLSRFLAEGLVLGLLGGSLGLLFTRAGLLVLPRLMASEIEINRIQELRMDPAVLAFAFLLSLICTFVFAVTPFLQASLRNILQMLKEGGREASGRERVRSSLVVIQVFLSVLLLVSVGLFLRSFLKVQNQQLGLDVKDVSTFHLSLPASRYPDAPSMSRFAEGLSQRLATIPGVTGVGASFIPAMSGSDMGTGAVPIELSGDSKARIRVSLDAVTPGYVGTLHIPLLRGRCFDSGDVRSSRPVVLINEALARHFYPGMNPVGKMLDVAIPQPGDLAGESEASPWEIVGVIQDTRDRDLEKAPAPRVLVPLSQAFFFPSLNVFVRTKLPVSSIEPSLRKALAEIDPQMAFGRVRTLEESIGQLVGSRRKTVVLLATFAVLALLLTAIGVYGVVSLSVASRTREIGVRVAFGARIQDIVRMVMGKGIRLVAMGFALGIAGALALGRLVSSQLYGVAPTDPLTLTVVALVLSFTALLACLIPALRAVSVDPSVALRNE